MGEQDSAVTSLSYWAGAAVWGMHGLWAERTLHTPQQQLQVLPCQATGRLGCLVALHARGTFVWKGKRSCVCWGFRKVRIREAWCFAKPAMRCWWGGFHKDVLQRPHGLFGILPGSYRQIYWEVVLQSPHVHVVHMDMVVQSPCHSTAPSVPNGLLH